MTQSSSQAAQFYREVAEARVVWTLDDENGYPAPKNRTGRRCMPFWSSKACVETIIRTVPAYSGFRPIGFAWEDFVAEWLPELKSSGFLVGVNWGGPDAVGWDLEPDDVVANVTAAIEGRESPFW
jgi:hypothetical protein